MRLEYYRDPKGNFGDDLNPWIWDRLPPGLIDDGADRLLIGQGTILERWFIDRLPAAGPASCLGPAEAWNCRFPNSVRTGGSSASGDR